jgi:HK97 family phage major capsid protein
MAEMIQAAVTKAMNAMPGYDKLLNAAPEGADHPETKSFGDFLVALQRHDVKRIEGVYKAALSEESGAVGGYLVPVEYSNQILRIATERSIVRAQNPTIVNMTTREFDFPALDHTGSTAGVDPRLGGVVATWTEEAGEKTETEPAFKNVKLVYHELSGYTLASAQVRMDAGPMLESMLRELFADAIAFTEDWAFINGDGAGKPLGVLKAPCLLTEVAATSTLVLSDILAMLEKFLPTRANGGVWFAHPKTLSKLAILADGAANTNNFVWANDAKSPIPTMLYGKPLIFTDRVPVLPASTGATQIGGLLLADWSQYLIGDRAGLQIDFSEHYKFINNQGTWRFAKYVDGQPKLGAAMYLADGTNQVSPFVSLSGS